MKSGDVPQDRGGGPKEGGLWVPHYRVLQLNGQVNEDFLKEAASQDGKSHLQSLQTGPYYTEQLHQGQPVRA